MDNRHAQIIALLKKVQSEGLDHDAALQLLETQGFTQEEIEQASYQLLYGKVATLTDDEIYTIVTELKQLRMQGLTYDQATAKMRERGYTDDQITEAANRFKYNNPVSYDKDMEAEHNNQPPRAQKAAPKSGAGGGWKKIIRGWGKR